MDSKCKRDITKYYKAISCRSTCYLLLWFLQQFNLLIITCVLLLCWFEFHPSTIIKTSISNILEVSNMSIPHALQNCSYTVQKKWLKLWILLWWYCHGNGEVFHAWWYLLFSYVLLYFEFKSYCSWLAFWCCSLCCVNPYQSTTWVNAY